MVLAGSPSSHPLRLKALSTGPMLVKWISLQALLYPLLSLSEGKERRSVIAPGGNLFWTCLLGTNSIYRLMFLLLCIPQLLDRQLQRHESHGPLRHAVSCALAKWECERAFELSFTSPAAGMVSILLHGRRTGFKPSTPLGGASFRGSPTKRTSSCLTHLA
jgi:hypothetical protein